MNKLNHTHNTKGLRMNLTNNDPRKQAGSNNLTLTVNARDWRLGGQTIRMTIRDAKALQNFLNQHLD